MIKVYWIGAVLAASGAVLSPLPASGAGSGILLNEDNSHFFTTRSAAEMTREGLHQFVDQYADTAVSHLFLSPNAMRASFKSKTRDAIWELGGQAMPVGAGKQWMDNARLLHERGLDPYAFWIARCREKKLSPWLSMRMNDIHDVPDDTSYMHSTFWLDHPEFRRVPDNVGGWTARALDFGHPEVRAHAMDFLAELFERYDPDGIELDWMRFGWHFKPGEEGAGAEILTQFMKEARALAQAWSEKRGHPIQLGARVPAHPDAARGLGMDGVLWAREGLIDVLVPTPFWTSSDFDIPVELWRERIAGTSHEVFIAPGLEYNLRAHPGGAPVANTLETVRGFAAAAWHRGADRIYLFNFMDSETIPVSTSDYRELVENGLDADHIARLPRRHVQTFRDTVPPGFDNGVVLPAGLESPAQFRINIGRKPSGGDVTIIAGLGAREGVEAAVLAGRINGAACTVLADGSEPGDYPGVVRALRFQCPLDAVLDGYNAIEIVQTDGGTRQHIEWIEIAVAPAP